MSFDIPLHIPDNSPEARVIEAIVLRDHVSPEKVVRHALRDLWQKSEGRRQRLEADQGFRNSLGQAMAGDIRHFDLRAILKEQAT